jgi:hypothetical protein
VETAIAVHDECHEVASCRVCGQRISEVFPSGGFVYVLSNPSLPGLIKVGCTERAVEERVKELSNHAGVAAPFIEEWSCAVPSPYDAEKEVHEALGSYRYSLNREFFKIDPRRTVEIILKVLSGSIILQAEGAVAQVPKNLEAAKPIISSGICASSAEPSAGGIPSWGFGSDRYA